MSTHQDLREGFLIGLELGCYRFKGVFQGPRPALPKLINVMSDHLELPVNAKQQKVGVAVNLARHLVNLPPNLLNPESYADIITRLFSSNPHVSIEVWTGERLKKERCHLLREVGAASQYLPALVHIRYRPQSKPHGSSQSSKDHGHRKGTEGNEPDHPIVFVGKGITFDSGGLDIKDGASMRIMKKDMGGSASALAIAWWVQETSLPVACDFYLALAENAIGSKAFRPGDVVLSRSGVSVEIDNTDAEGRLVMADAIDVALEQNPHLKFLVNLSTLTGAMRVALGTRIAGYFTNQNSLVPKFEESAQKRGELVWRMPLHGEYRGHLKSSFADIANSGPQRFGGAISAAMFLHRFAGRVPWVHVDHYSWTDGPAAGCLEPGGTGQMVQLFADLLDQV
jgi:leucyl aminopeptidase